MDEMHFTPKTHSSINESMTFVQTLKGVFCHA